MKLDPKEIIERYEIALNDIEDIALSATLRNLCPESGVLAEIHAIAFLATRLEGPDDNESSGANNNE